MGQSLILGCNFTTVRGITSRVDVVWSSDGEELRKIEGVNVSLTLVTSAVYVATYTIPQLSTTDDGRVYLCEVVINTSPPVIATTRTILDVTGNMIQSFCSYSAPLYHHCSSKSCFTYNTIWSYSRSCSRWSSRLPVYS